MDYTPLINEYKTQNFKIINPKNERFVTLFYYLSIMYNQGIDQSDKYRSHAFLRVTDQIRGLAFEIKDGNSIASLSSVGPDIINKIDDYIKSGGVIIPEIDNLSLSTSLFKFINESPNQWYFNFDGKFTVAISKTKYSLHGKTNNEYIFKKNLIIL